MNSEHTARQLLLSFRTEPAKDALSRLRAIQTKILPLIGDAEWNRHVMVTQNVTTIARVLYLNELYKLIVNVPGVICEFGVQWGATLAQLINLRAIHEPFNHSRLIYGFDTFCGFPSVHDKDGSISRPGDLQTMPDYEELLEEILSNLEHFPPMSHLKKFELVKGDVTFSVDKWLANNPHAIISLAILDLDLYEPTLHVLNSIRDRLTKGSVVAFDELNCKAFPGETLAVAEALGLRDIRLRRSPLHPFCAWTVIGE